MPAPNPPLFWPATTPAATAWPASVLELDGWRFTIGQSGLTLCMTNDRRRVTWCVWLTYRVWAWPMDGSN